MASNVLPAGLLPVRPTLMSLSTTYEQSSVSTTDEANIANICKYSFKVITYASEDL